MGMVYNNNPNLPRVRMQAVRLVGHNASIRETARHFGYTHGAIRRWIEKANTFPLIRKQSKTFIIKGGFQKTFLSQNR